jgi:hypothetical protein
LVYSLSPSLSPSNLTAITGLSALFIVLLFTTTGYLMLAPSHQLASLASHITTDIIAEARKRAHDRVGARAALSGAGVSTASAADAAAAAASSGDSDEDVEVVKGMRETGVLGGGERDGRNR